MKGLNAIMYDEKYSTENIEHDLKLIHDWCVKWKMLFNPDITCVLILLLPLLALLHLMA